MGSGLLGLPGVKRRGHAEALQSDPLPAHNESKRPLENAGAESSAFKRRD